MRESRGLSLEEAARDTRVRLEFLEAIEADDFERLLGDVHVRGCLRTYATYLRLSPDKVVAAYEREFGSDEQVEFAPAPPRRTEPVLGRRRRRDDHRLWILVAAVVLVLAAAFGVLSAQRPAPAPAELAGATAQLGSAAVPRPISVAVVARRPVDVTIVADGGDPQRFELEADEGRSFEADASLTIRLSEGASASITVNGTPHGYPGEPGEPWGKTYSYEASPPPGS